MAELDCRIVTPEGVIFDGRAERVIVPGVEGELGVLARHAPLVARLKIGAVELKFSDGSSRVFAINEGYFKVQRDLAQVLVEGAIDSAAVDVEAVRAEAEDARRRLAAADAGDAAIDRFRAERDLAYAENQLSVVGR